MVETIRSLYNCRDLAKNIIIIIIWMFFLGGKAIISFKMEQKQQISVKLSQKKRNIFKSRKQAT